MPPEAPQHGSPASHPADKPATKKLPWAEDGTPRSRWVLALQHIVYVEGDTERTVRHKLWLVLTGICSVVGTLLGVANRSSTSFLSWFSLAYALPFFATWLVWVLVFKRIDKKFIVFFAVGSTIGIIGRDLYTAPIMSRSWSMFVLILDVLLVFRASMTLTRLIIAFVLVWMIVVQLEYSYRFGLFDMPGLPSYDERRELVDCNKPPCSQSFGSRISSLLYDVSVFILDFMLTRSFAQQVQTEQQTLHHAITIAQQIAADLASFDLEPATRKLEEHADAIPEELRDSYRLLLYNLGSYKPYLPQSLVSWGVHNEATPRSETLSQAERMASLEVAENVRSALVAHPPPEAFEPSIGERGPGDLAGLEDGDSSSSDANDIMKTTQFTRTVRRQNFLRRMDVTLVKFNAPLPKSDPARLLLMHEVLTSLVVSIVTEVHGVVDVLTGDSLQVSFNTAAHVPDHAAVALRTVDKFCEEAQNRMPTGDCNGVVVSGSAHVGLLGFDELQRPSIIGQAPDCLAVLDSYIRARPCAWACNRATYMCCGEDFPMRLLLDRVVPSVGPLTPVYELLLTGTGTSGGGSLYSTTNQALSTKASPQAVCEVPVYNKVGLAYLENQDATAACKSIDAEEVSIETKHLFREALKRGCTVTMGPSIVQQRPEIPPINKGSSSEGSFQLIQIK